MFFIGETMTIKFVDKNGSLKVVTVPDESDFDVKESEDGTFHIYSHVPGLRGSRMRTNRTLAESLDKVIADKCIERIYDQLIAKKDYCDLAELQLGTASDNAETNDNDNK